MPQRDKKKRDLYLWLAQMMRDTKFWSIAVFSILTGRHKGRHTVPVGVLCLTVAL